MTSLGSESQSWTPRDGCRSKLGNKENKSQARDEKKKPVPKRWTQCQDNPTTPPVERLTELCFRMLRSSIDSGWKSPSGGSSCTRRTMWCWTLRYVSIGGYWSDQIFKVSIFCKFFSRLYFQTFPGHMPRLWFWIYTWISPRLSDVYRHVGSRNHYESDWLSVGRHLSQEKNLPLRYCPLGGNTWQVQYLNIKCFWTKSTTLIAG